MLWKPAVIVDRLVHGGRLLMKSHDRKLLGSGLTLDDLRQASPVHPDDNDTNIEKVIDYLYRGGSDTPVLWPYQVAV